MKNLSLIKLSLASSIALLSSNTFSQDKSSNLIDSLPWASSISLNQSEFIEQGEIEEGFAGSASFTQSIRFNHALKKYFDMGFYIKGAYLSSDNTRHYWENKTDVGFGLEFVSQFSNDLVNWGQIKLILGKKRQGHHDDIGKPFDETLNEISLTISTTGDLL